MVVVIRGVYCHLHLTFHFSKAVTLERFLSYTFSCIFDCFVIEWFVNGKDVLLVTVINRFFLLTNSLSRNTEQ